MRHFWLDRIDELEPGIRAIGRKTVALTEDIMHDHFPGNPVMPGVLIIEGLAQAAGVLLTESTGRRCVAVMVSIDRARFSSFARPGDTLRFAVDVEDLGADAARVRAQASVDGREVAATRISFRLIPAEQMIAPAYLDAWRQTLDVWLGRFPVLPGA
jgi:3-hydroxyacyl-[acyl-carrier-protein] dehydratase